MICARYRVLAILSVIAPVAYRATIVATGNCISSRDHRAYRGEEEKKNEAINGGDIKVRRTREMGGQESETRDYASASFTRALIRNVN